MIPTILHTVWVGENPIPSIESEFIENNKKILSEYTFKLWKNENIHELITGSELEPFINYALTNKKYAHASDAIKILALKKFGGWAIDADNKILLKLDEFQHHNWVSGFELYKNSGKVPITAAWGAIPNHKFTQRIINYYLNNTHEHLVRITNASFISKILINEGKIINNNQKQYSQDFDVTIYPHWTFCTPKNNEKSYIIHNFSASWQKKTT